jgi:Raf kinase inhibitor-like YbhB/YbcL family protein
MRRTTVPLGLASALALAACGGGERPAATRPAAPVTLTLTSPSFAPGAEIPRRLTCDGEGTAPGLRWSRPPAGTRELAVVLRDPDARGGAFVHWVVLALAPGSRGIPAGTKPATLRLGRASSGRVGYQPPCPPEGEPPHRYVFTVYALRRPLNLPEGTSARRAEAAIAAAAIARGTLTGRYGR